MRFEADDDTRYSEMPAFSDILEPGQIREVSAYVYSLTNPPLDAGLIAAGAEVYAENCASCHGDDAKGDVEFGAPDLADAIWFYGDSEAEIANQIAKPKHGVMPGWAERLGEPTIKQLSVFVHSLGGGQ